MGKLDEIFDTIWSELTTDEDKKVFPFKKAALQKLWSFAGVCTVETKPPTVHNINVNGSIPYKKKYVKPNVYITHNGEKYRIDNLHSLRTCTQMYDSRQQVVIVPAVPTMYIAFEFGYFGGSWYKYSEELGRVFVEDVSENWDKVVDACERHWKEIEYEAEVYYAAHLARRGKKERASSVKSLVPVLVRSAGLVNIPPELIHAAVQIQPSDLELLYKYVKRQQAKIDLIEVEDIKEAQDQAMVETTLKS